MSSIFKYVLVALATATVCVFVYSIFTVPAATPSIPWEDSRGTPSDYPVNLEIKGVVDEIDIELVHKVTFDSKKQQYVYYYRIEYLGDSVCLFSWDNLNIMRGSEQVPSLMEFVPGESKEFSFFYKNPPMMHYGQVEIYFKKNDKWQMKTCPPQLGPVPNSQVPRKNLENKK